MTEIQGIDGTEAHESTPAGYAVIHTWQSDMDGIVHKDRYKAANELQVIKLAAGFLQQGATSISITKA